MIKGILKKIHRSEEGAVAVIAAVAFTAMIMLTGVVIDLGRSYAEASALQADADVIAYSASVLLPVKVGDSDKMNEVTSKALEYAVKNGRLAESVQQVELGGEVGEMYTSVKVTLKSNIKYIFGQLLGITEKDLSREATVQIQSVIASSDMVPLGISTENLLNTLALNGAQDVVLKYTTGDLGFFGALNLSGMKGGGANTYSQWLEYGYEGVIAVGDILSTEPGNMTGPTETSFAARFDSCTHFPGDGGCTTEHFITDCPRVTFLIVYDRISTTSVLVTGFRPFILTGLNELGEITASVIDVKRNTGESVPIDGTNINFGLFKPRLIG
jgi:Flp pilus assembly protein TadG